MGLLFNNIVMLFHVNEATLVNREAFVCSILIVSFIQCVLMASQENYAPKLEIAILELIRIF